MSSSPSLPRVALLGGSVLLGLSALAVSWGLAACASLSNTTPIPDGDASDLDAGYTPPLSEEDAGETTPFDAGAPPASGRIRLANLLQGPGAVDLCTKSDATGAAWESQKVPNPSGLGFGQVSAHVFLPAGSQGTRYQFRVVPLGSPCDGDGASPLVSIAAGTSTTLRQGSGLTISAIGVAKDNVDAGDGAPRGSVNSDVVSPPSTAALVRVVHGVPELPPFDVTVNGEIILTGIKYGTASPFCASPSSCANGGSGGGAYASSSGFAQIPAGIPQDATLALKAGTSTKSFVVPERVRRGVAVTIFVGGTPDSLLVNLCSDRSPPAGQTLAECTKLRAISE